MTKAMAMAGAAVNPKHMEDRKADLPAAAMNMAVGQLPNPDRSLGRTRPSAAALVAVAIPAARPWPAIRVIAAVRPAAIPAARP